jgi:hypothetical protein
LADIKRGGWQVRLVPKRKSDPAWKALLDKMMVKSPGVIVPMTGATSIVEFELVKAD